MNERDFELLLEKCRQDLAQGRDLAGILNEHPDQAQRLEPLLLAAQVASGLSRQEASQASVLRGRNRLLAEADQLQRKGHFLKNGTKWSLSRYSGRWYTNIGNLLVTKENPDMKLFPRLAIYLLITVLVAGFFTVNASASSLPGDALYNLKLGWEDIQKALAFSDDARLQLEQEFEQERLSEVQALLGQGRTEDVEFIGVIDAMESSIWSISGIPVLVDASTELKGQLEVGALVKVEAITQQDGSLLAIEIYPTSLIGSDDVLSEDSTETPEVEDEIEAETQEMEDENETETPEGTETEEESESDSSDHSTPEPEKTQKPDDHGGDDGDKSDDD